MLSESGPRADRAPGVYRTVDCARSDPRTHAQALARHSSAAGADGTNLHRRGDRLRIARSGRIVNDRRVADSAIRADCPRLYVTRCGRDHVRIRVTIRNWIGVYGTVNRRRTGTARGRFRKGDRRYWVWWFNHHRLLEPLGYLPPAEYEEHFHRTAETPVSEVALT